MSVVEEGRHVGAGALQRVVFSLPPSLFRSLSLSLSLSLPPFLSYSVSLSLLLSLRRGLLGACCFPAGLVYFPGMSAGTIES
jgi:hypothetical protein